MRIHEWILTALLAANIVWTTLCLGGYLPQTMVVTSGLTALLLVVALAGVAAGLPFGSRSAGWWFFPFLAYALANVAWIAPVPWLGWHDWFWWAQMVAVFWVAVNGVRSSGPRRFLLGSLVAVAAVSAALGVYQVTVDPQWLMLGRIQVPQFEGRASGSFGIPNSLAALLLLALPVACVAGFRGRGWARAGFLAAAALAFAGLVLSISRGGWIAFALSMAVWPLLGSRRTWRWKLSAVLVAIGGLAVSGAILYQASPLIRERLDQLAKNRGELSRPILWRASWAMARAEPVFGTGAGSFNIRFENHRPEHFRNDPQWAHNDYLNTLSDYGTLGFVLFFGPAAALWMIHSRRRGAAQARGKEATGIGTTMFDPDEPAMRSALAVGILGFCLQLSVDFHLKIPALAMSLAAVAALLVNSAAGSGDRRIYRRAGRILAGGVALGTIVFYGTRMLPHYRAEGVRAESRRVLDRLALTGAVTASDDAAFEASRIAFRRATLLDPLNSQAWSDLSYAAALRAIGERDRVRERGIEAESSARRALNLSGAVFEYWLRLGVALDLQDRWIEAGAAYNRALEMAPRTPSSWYYLAYHYSLRPTTAGLARSAIATSLRLDPGNRAAEAFQRRLAEKP